MLDICKSHCPLLSFKQRIGYLAASQSFHEDLDILMLTTNMIRKVCNNSLSNIHVIIRVYIYLLLGHHWLSMLYIGQMIIKLIFVNYCSSGPV